MKNQKSVIFYFSRRVYRFFKNINIFICSIIELIKDKNVVLDELWADKLCCKLIHPNLKEEIGISRRKQWRVRYCISRSSAFPFYKVDMIDIVYSEPGFLSGCGTWYCAKTGEKAADWRA